MKKISAIGLAMPGIFMASVFFTLESQSSVSSGEDNQTVSEAVHDHEKGLSLAEQGNYEEAVAHFKNALRLDPDQEEVLYDLGIVYGKMKNYEGAERCLERAEELNPSLDSEPFLKEAYLRIGIKNARTHIYGKAIESFRKALIIAPDDPITLYNLGVTYGMAGKTDLAISTLNRARERAPEDPAVRFNLGNLYKKNQSYQKARHEFEKAIEYEPEFVEAYYNLGVVSEYNDEGIRYGDGFDSRVSIDAYQKVLERQSYHQEARYNMAVVYWKLRQYEDAIDELKRVVALDPDMSEAHFLLGTIYTSLGAYNNAMREFDMVLELQPDSQEARRNLAELHRLMGDSRKSSYYYKEYIDQVKEKYKSTPAPAQTAYD